MPTKRSRSAPGRTPRTRGRPAAGTAAAAGISSAAVAKATGRTWDEWFAILDRAGAAEMAHRDIAAHLRRKHDIAPWWTQMVTVGYEQVRLGRPKHAQPDGFRITVTRTVGVPLATLYRAWSAARTRARWLPETGLEVRGAAKDESMRLTWSDGRSRVEARFAAKGDGKSQVAVEHGKLASATAAQAMKKLWGERLAALKTMLEAPR